MKLPLGPKRGSTYLLSLFIYLFKHAANVYNIMYRSYHGTFEIEPKIISLVNNNFALLIYISILLLFCNIFNYHTVVDDNAMTKV